MPVTEALIFAPIGNLPQCQWRYARSLPPELRATSAGRLVKRSSPPEVVSLTIAYPAVEDHDLEKIRFTYRGPERVTSGSSRSRPRSSVLGGRAVEIRGRPDIRSRVFAMEGKADVIAYPSKRLKLAHKQQFAI